MMETSIYKTSSSMSYCRPSCRTTSIAAHRIEAHSTEYENGDTYVSCDPWTMDDGYMAVGIYGIYMWCVGAGVRCGEAVTYLCTPGTAAALNLLPSRS